MKRAAVILSVLILMSILFTSCQKAKEVEEKKESQIQKEEVKQDPSEVKPEVQLQQPSSPIAQKATDETPQTTSTSEKTFEFKEPVLLWEREFEPPLIDISDQNSAGEYIAIQGGGKEGRPTKILFLDSKGKTAREIPFGKKEKRKIPAEQVWLTYYGEQWKTEAFKKSFSSSKEIETITEKAFISGSGEYYAIVTRDTATESAGPEMDTYSSSWYEFAYYDKTGKQLWKAVPKDNYGFATAHISHDGSRVFLIDKANLDYFGQRWYLFDNRGNILNSEDHMIKLIGMTQKDRDREVAEFIIDDRIEFSPSACYIAWISGDNWSKSKVTLRTGDGNLLWSKVFDEKGHHGVKVNDQGNLIISGEKEPYLINKGGNIITNYIRGNLSETGNFIIEIGRKENDDELTIYKAIDGKKVFHVRASEIFRTRDIDLSLPRLIMDKYLVFNFYKPDKTGSNIAMINILEGKSIIWKKEDLAIRLYVYHYKGSKKISLRYNNDKYSGTSISKIVVFDILG